MERQGQCGGEIRAKINTENSLEKYRALERSRWFRFLKSYLEFGIKLGQVNPAGEQDGFGPSVARDKLPLWSLAAELYYYYFSLKLLLTLVLQHHYNGLSHELRSLEPRGATSESWGQLTSISISNGNSSNGSSSGGFVSPHAQKQAELERALGRLQLLGNAYYELGYALEPILIFVFYIIYLTYLQTRLYVLVRGPILFGVLRLFLDPVRERQHVTEPDIGRQTSRFIGSSLNHLQACAGCPPEKPSRAGLSAPPPRPPTVGACTHHLLLLLLAQGHKSPRERELAHERLVADLCALGASGELVPLNRRPEWAGQLARIYTAMLSMFWLSAASLGSAILLALPYSGLLPNLRMHNDTWRHLLFQAELLLYGLLGVQWAAFQVIMLIATLLDLVKFVLALKGEVLALTRDICRDRDRRLTSCHSLAELNGPPGGRPTATTSAGRHDSTDIPIEHRNLNRRLLRVLILYKLLNGQLRSSQKLVGWVAAMMVIVMMLAPVMARLYVAYLAREWRLAFLVWALFVIMTSDFLMIPNCELYARCLDLFKSMSYLLTHIDEHRAYCPIAASHGSNCQRAESLSGTRGQWAYDEHTVWLLRREQSLPELAMQRFATDAYFLRITYKGFIGIHFWCGILLTPMLVKDAARGVGGGGAGGRGGNLLANSLKIF